MTTHLLTPRDRVRGLCYGLAHPRDPTAFHGFNHAHMSVAHAAECEACQDAVALCQLCPLQEPCLEEELAVGTPEAQVGVRGGKTAPQRARILRRRDDWQQRNR